ncbi:MAG: hypothetical protein GY754_26930 [bacterium]|nr:hypothetical protein [bacterium]
MKISRWYVILITSLLLVSATSYLAQIHIFNKAHDTFFYMLQDFAFVPIQVLMVTLILDRLFKKREKQALLQKLNMIIGIFFHDIGSDLIIHFGNFIKEFEAISSQLKITPAWSEKDFVIKSKDFDIEADHIDIDEEKLADLKKYLLEKRESLLNLMGSPSLLEHERFTNLLWAVFHLTDELFHRESLTGITSNDTGHLKGDMIRVYNLLIVEWLAYMRHLRRDYPYLYSIAIRTNPFDPEADVTIKK